MSEAPDFPGLLSEHEFAWALESDDLDELRGLADELSDRLGRVNARIFEIENGADEWTAHRDCITGERRVL